MLVIICFLWMKRYPQKFGELCYCHIPLVDAGAVADANRNHDHECNGHELNQE